MTIKCNDEILRFFVLSDERADQPRTNVNSPFFFSRSVSMCLVCVGFTPLQFHELMGQLSLLTEQIYSSPNPFQPPTGSLHSWPPRRSGTTTKMTKRYQPRLPSYSKSNHSFLSVKKRNYCMNTNGVWYDLTNHTQVFHGPSNMYRLTTDTFTLICSDQSHPIDWICVMCLPYKSFRVPQGRNLHSDTPGVVEEVRRKCSWICIGPD